MKANGCSNGKMENHSTTKLTIQSVKKSNAAECEPPKLVYLQLSDNPKVKAKAGKYLEVST